MTVSGPHSLGDRSPVHLQAKQAHWNVKGPQFIALHELFDKVASEAEEMADNLAERAIALGGEAPGTARVVSRQTRLPEYPFPLSRGRDHVKALSAALAAFGRTARQGIDQAARLPDADTADLFTEISRDIDKLLWFVEAHQQSDS